MQVMGSKNLVLGSDSVKQPIAFEGFAPIIRESSLADFGDLVGRNSALSA